MKKLILALCLLTGCYRPPSDELFVSIQIQDRNGLTETISAPERLANYQSLDFLGSQPYKKVLRVFKQAGKQTAKITTYHPNGLPWKYLEAQDMRAFGAYKEWHPNGQLKVESIVIGGPADLADATSRDWLFDGTAKCYDDQGRLMAQIPYEKGALHGVSVYYYTSGQIEKELPFVQNLLEGESRTFTADGKLAAKTTYKKGLKVESFGFWPNGNSSWVEHYENGLLQQGRYQKTEGNIVSEVQNGNGFQAVFHNETLSTLIEYREGKPEGIVKTFSPEGELLSTHHVVNEQKHGEEIFYGKAKQPKLSISWQQDAISGLVKTWYPNGGLQSQREFSQNKKTGPSLSWYPNGQLMSVEEYEEDILTKGDYFKLKHPEPVSSVVHGNGWATLYDENGIFLRKVQYIKGKPVDPE